MRLAPPQSGNLGGERASGCGIAAAVIQLEEWKRWVAKGSLSVIGVAASVWPQTKAGENWQQILHLKGRIGCWVYSIQFYSLSLSRPHLNVPPRMFSSQSTFFAMKPPPVAAPSPPIEIPAVVRALFRHGGAGDRGRETRLQTAENGSRTRKPFL